MTTAAELLRQGRRDEIWKKYCGFLDFSLEEFMKIQKRLLMEQIDLLSKCELGRKFLGDKVPTSVEEFRETVPLTTYEDYLPYLAGKREDVLPEKPLWWLRTSGRSGEYECKWIPYTPRMMKRVGEHSLATIIFASCSRRGEFVFEPGDTMLFALAPFPYVSGALARGFLEEFDFVFIPPIEEAEKMSFEERLREGFRIGLRTGIDAFNGVGSVLVRIGEQFSQSAGTFRISADLFHPRVLSRLIRGLISSKMAGRGLLPKDIWTLKCIGTGGTDTMIFREQIEEYWGRKPIEGYGCSEAGGQVSAQLWNCKGLTFFPDTCFLEFLPEDEHVKLQEDASYQPRILRLSEVEANQKYELVITSFFGGAFVRYTVGDFIEIASLRDDEIGVDIPQMVFYSRADGVIDIATFTRLTEKVIWQAIENSGVRYVDWTIRKERGERKPILHLYIELKDEGREKDEIREAIHQSLKAIDVSYAEMEDIWDIDPLVVTTLRPGSFDHYYTDRVEEGADLAHLKPPHMNASDEVIDKLLLTSDELSEV